MIYLSIIIHQLTSPPHLIHPWPSLNGPDSIRHTSPTPRPIVASSSLMMRPIRNSHETVGFDAKGISIGRSKASWHTCVVELFIETKILSTKPYYVSISWRIRVMKRRILQIIFISIIFTILKIKKFFYHDY